MEIKKEKNSKIRERKKIYIYEKQINIQRHKNLK